ncbi:two-component sensor histidine kinase [Actinoplanes philippinensis]|uniref:histidine kinase n=1 Tax=Actinoplanes philippinensis TaxID=35752 RepID=A0A1I2EKZ8_9ACTN|nr:histidine kinase [Actinoplanes philippinensis]GIE82580.1 two-component sensor histidine kinase [Actinoplanes philippinensis]SFE93774.1 Signal transduction histidine kinase [Actinoplanes philippinensis]
MHLSRWDSWRPQLLDAAVGVVLFGAPFVVAVADAGGGHPQPRQDWREAAVAVCALALVTFRRRRPLPVFGASVVLTLLTTAVPRSLPAAALACLLCLYTVATRCRRAVAWPSGLVAGGAVALAAGSTAGPEAVAIVASAGLVVAVGDVIRTRRAYLAEVRERDRRTELDREQESRRRVIEERLRIARELHDVVAHNIAMINVQAGVAAHVLRSRPDQAEESLAHVRRASRTVLTELSTVLGVLRDPRLPDGTAEEPVRGLEHLPELIDQLAGAGLRVEHVRDGRARALPAAVDLAAYRIVQESLTNAHKYAPDGRAALRLRFTADTLEITVGNRATGGPSGDGYGLAGMRERAVALGGRLSAGFADGRFVVHALLPVPGDPA